MGYRVKRYAPGSDKYKVLYETRSGGVRTTRAVKDGEAGFHPGQSYEQAVAAMKRANADEALKRMAAVRGVIDERLALEGQQQAAYLGEAELEAFERRTFGRRFVHEDDRAPSYWAMCKRIILQLRIPPVDWEDERGQFYDAFRSNAYSLNTTQKLLRYLNLWGKFISKLKGTPFYPIPAPRGIERSRLLEAWQKKKSRPGNKKSLPLTPALLESKRGALAPEEWRWLALSLFFGLRPSETCAVASGLPEVMEVAAAGEVPVLRVYQTKVKAWKAVPALYPEQERVLAQLTLPHALPSYKTLRKVFGRQYGRYAGRHGFPKWMKANGELLEDVSLWMGHSDISTTHAHYVDRLEVSLGKRGRKTAA